MMKHCEKVFNLFDEDGDGKLTPSQLQSCIAALGCELSTEEAEMVAARLVPDGDWLVGLNEFSDFVESGSEEEKMEDLRKVFEMYKMDGDECISPRSLKTVLQRLGEWSLDECVEMINRFDVDGDGVLSFQEFHLMMMQ